MKAMILRQYGGPENFEPADIAKPEIKPGHVMVRIAATSVNTVDTMIRQLGEDLPLSPDLPAILGMDFAGTIEEIGEGVTQFKVGDEVYAAPAVWEICPVRWLNTWLPTLTLLPSSLRTSQCEKPRHFLWLPSPPMKDSNAQE